MTLTGGAMRTTPGADAVPAVAQALLTKPRRTKGQTRMDVEPNLPSPRPARAELPRPEAAAAAVMRPVEYTLRKVSLDVCTLRQRRRVRCSNPRGIEPRPGA